MSDDPGYDIVMVPGGSVRLVRQGQSFELQGYTPPPTQQEATPWRPPPWVYPNALVAVLDADSDEMVAAIDANDLAIPAAELGDAPSAGRHGLNLVGTVTPERLEEALTVPTVGETLRVHVIASTLDLDAFQPKIDQVRLHGGRVEFLVVPDE
ncbi:MAG: hypothetical protein JWN46_2892 [Acidimicrobiales bacterium]|nr:hypothetical protein [Acidimicrobiales bacterium]